MAELRTTLEDAYKWEKTSPNRIWMTQPIGDGQVVTYTWAQGLDQARRRQNEGHHTPGDLFIPWWNQPAQQILQTQ